MFRSSIIRFFFASPLYLIYLLLMLGCNERLIEPESPMLIMVNATLSETDSVRVFIRARVSDVDDPDLFLEEQVNVGDEVSCSYLFDPTCSDSKQNKSIGQYIFNHPPYGIRIAINNLIFSSDSSSVYMTILLKDDVHQQGLHDVYEVSSSNNLEVLPGVGVSDIIILLEDLDASALSSDALLDSVPDLSYWPATHELTIKGSDGWTILANINAISTNSNAAAAVDGSNTKDRFQRQ